MTPQVWTSTIVIDWTQCLLNSYRHWMNRELFERPGRSDLEANQLFHAPFIMVSHGVETDPVLNYGNQRALDLWELTWDELVQMPSRLTAEPSNQVNREKMLAGAKTRGYLDAYRGVRISSTGRRFLVENALIYDVLDAAGGRIGQAATFSYWTCLP